MEGMPFAILEAMAASKPVIASKIYGIPEVVVEGETGFMVPPRDAGFLCAAMRRAIESPALCRRMGTAGRMRVESSFSLERMVREVESVYEAVLSGRPVTAPR
jgi:glycosyltransferase involved in cell wall biosynthesis